MTIITQTGWWQPNDRDSSREAECDSHLMKPGALAKLERILQEKHRSQA